MAETTWNSAHNPADPDVRDRALVQAIAQGDARALEALYAQHGVMLLAYLIGQVSNRQLAEEVLQDVMIAVWKGAARFRGDSTVKTWMLAIARRRAITARQRVVDHDPLPDEVASRTAGPPETLEDQAERDAVRRAIHQLAPDQRETLELIFYHDLTGPQAAEVLGVAPGTIKSRLHRAKTRLQTLLGQQEHIDA